MRIRIKNNKLRITGIMLLALLITYYSLFAVSEVYALEPTTPTKTASSSTTLAEKLNQLKQQIASKAAQLKKEVNKKLQNRAIAGIITLIDENKITITTKDGAKTIITNEYTDFQISKPKSKKGSIKDLSKDDFIVGLGDLDDKNNLTAKRVVKTQKPDRKDIDFVWGKIETVSNPVINIKAKDGKKIAVLTGDTVFWLGNLESSIADAKINKYLIARGELKDLKLSTDMVYFIPTVGFVKPEKKIATTSASATPSAKKN